MHWSEFRPLHQRRRLFEPVLDVSKQKVNGWNEVLIEQIFTALLSLPTSEGVQSLTPQFLSFEARTIAAKRYLFHGHFGSQPGQRDNKTVDC